ncbi:hypothetical protein GCN74_24765 [Janthinobacterium sp. FT14W]|uniref:hypothetical protein n=1 Tax=Janthinobacterium sp. FT14W TaxID=2654253 RepID=UPI0012649206|nr:hypothetical protein [Janthinobacterium sp. FT14W]KAB8054435.1 hypothetical protein GCN74_24765 [Janthinobacterium sp. FT14W]
MRPLFAIGLGVVATALVLEVVLQCLPVVSGLRMADSSSAVPFNRYLPGQPYVYSHGWALANARRGVTNAQGYNNSADFQEGAAVLVLGDSFVESLMLDYADTVQGKLDQVLGGKVYAAAGSGNGLADGLEMLRYYQPRLHPRTVLLFVDAGNLNGLLAPAQRGHSNFVVDGQAVSVAHNPYAESKVKRLVAHSALARYVYYNLKLSDWLLSKFQGGKPAGAAAAAPAGAREAALEFYLAQLRQAGGAATRIIFLVDGERNLLYEPGHAKPQWHGDNRAFFLERARRHGYAVADMQPVFAQHWALRRERMDFLPMDGHWNKVAHALAAQQVLPLLAADGPPPPGIAGN